MLDFPDQILKKDQSAFTLIELIAVVGIVLVLISMLLAGISKVRDRADAIKCTSNLRQCGILVAAYIVDHNGDMPGAAPYWPISVNPSQQNGFVTEPYNDCPTRSSAAVPKACYGMNARSFGGGYAYGEGAVKAAAVKHPSKTLLLTDTITAEESGNPNNNTFKVRPGALEGIVFGAVPAFKHQGRCNILFVDGHVEAKTPQEIGTEDGGPLWWYWAD